MEENRLILDLKNSEELYSELKVNISGLNFTAKNQQKSEFFIEFEETITSGARRHLEKFELSCLKHLSELLKNENVPNIELQKFEILTIRYALAKVYCPLNKLKTDSETRFKVLE